MPPNKADIKSAIKDRRTWVTKGALSGNRLLGLGLHQARLSLRERLTRFTGKRAMWGIFLLLLAIAGMGFAGQQFALQLKDPSLTQLHKEAMAAGFGLILCLVIHSNALIAASQALNDRGDLDLLASAPVPTTTLSSARAIGGLLTGAIMPLLMAGSVLLVPAITVSPRYLCGFLGIIGAALLITTWAQFLIGWLNHFAGKTKARILAQLISVAILAPPIMMANAGAMEGNHKSFMGVMIGWMADLIPQAPFMGDIALGFLDSPIYALGLLAAGILGFGLSAEANGRAFAAAIAASDAPKAKVATKKGKDQFSRAPLWALLVKKEWQAIGRNPWTLTHLGLQMIGLIPIIWTFFALPEWVEETSGAMVATITSLIVVISFFTNQVVSAFAWLSATGDTAPLLFSLAPQQPTLARWTKAAPAMVAAIILAIGVGSLIGMRSAPKFGILAAICVLLSAGAAIYVETSRIVPTDRPMGKMTRLTDRPALSIIQAGLLTLSASATCIVTLCLGLWGILPACAFLGLTYLCAEQRPTLPNRAALSRP